jgi:hypothetical protein
MSLLSTSSTTQQEAYLYENHYPQPIIVAPNSQICLQKFIHYRGALYEVTTQNNTIGFRFGTGGATLDMARFATIPTGSYDGNDLATAVTTALNSVNQQQNYEWLCTFTPAPSANDNDQFQIQYSSVPTPDENSGTYNQFSSGQISVSNENKVNEEAKITYNGTNADHFANVISKRSTLVYLGSQTWNMIQPNKNTEAFQPIQMGLVRKQLSNPNDPNPNLQFAPDRYDIALECQGDSMAVTYGRQRQGSVVGAPNWFQSDIRRGLDGLFNAVFKPGGNFSPHTKLQATLTIYASSQTSRRVLIQLFKKESGETTYTALADGLGGNSPVNNQPYIKTLNIGGDSFPGLCFDSNDPTLNDTNTKISQHYPNLKKAPFFPAVSFQKAGNNVLTGYALDADSWQNAAQTSTAIFIPLTGNANGYNWRTDGTLLSGYYWKQIDALNFHVMSGDVPLTDPPEYVAVLDPTGNTNGQIEVRDGTTNNLFRTMNSDGSAPVAEVTGKLSIFTQGIFNTFEPIPGVSTSSEALEETPGAEGGGLGVDLSSNARLFLRGAGGGVEADVANLLGFSQNEEDFGGGAATGASVTSDQEPQQTANNNTLHISIPEMPLVKSYEGENSAEGKSVAIIPREEFHTGETEGSLVYVAPFENWIDINNGQELNINLITTIIRNADGSLADNLVRETQAIFKIRQDPTKKEEERKAEKFKEMAELMANTLNTGLTALIKPQQLIGS